jgi:hypothetical protein
MMRTKDLEMFRGDDLRVIVEVRDQDNNPVDISDAVSITWAVANSATSEILLQKELGDGITINTDTSFFFDISSAESATLDGRCYQEAEVVTDQNKTYTVMSGAFIVKKALILGGES